MKKEPEIKTFEIFTENFSRIIQDESIKGAIVQFTFECPMDRIIKINDVTFNSKQSPSSPKSAEDLLTEQQFIQRFKEKGFELYKTEEIEKKVRESKLTIEFNDWSYTCGDGCCTEWGTLTKVNGVEMPFQDDNTASIVKMILNHLGYEVEIIDNE